MHSNNGGSDGDDDEDFGGKSVPAIELVVNCKFNEQIAYTTTTTAKNKSYRIYQTRSHNIRFWSGDIFFKELRSFCGIFLLLKGRKYIYMNNFLL